jgi:hypothetical protein
MEKDKLAKRLSYIKDKSYGLMDGHDTFRNRKLLREAIIQLCEIVEELNAEMEKDKEPKHPY